MGRRQQVIDESAQKLCSEGFEAVGVQVTATSFLDWLAIACLLVPLVFAHRASLSDL